MIYTGLFIGLVSLGGVIANPQTVNQVKDCPVGFQLSGKQCVAVEVQPHLISCPAGTHSEGNGHCAAHTQALKKCPNGYQQSGKSCTVVHSAPAIPQCPRGTELQHDSVCVKVIENPPVCPAGFSFDSAGSCSAAAAPLPKCPAGFSLTGSQCTRKVPAVPVCHTESTLHHSGRHCEKIVIGHPSCPHGFSMSAIGCERFVPSTFAPCPHAHTVASSKPGHCQTTVKHVPTPVCAAGFEHHDAQSCRKEIPVLPYCSPGYVQGPNGHCVQSTPQLVSCPQQFQLVGSVCKKVNLHPKIPICPPGFEQSKDRCKTIEQSEPEYQCPAGSSRSHLGCSVVNVHKPRLVCPSGYEFASPGKCIRTVQKDCSTKSYKEECAAELAPPSLPPSKAVGVVSPIPQKGLRHAYRRLNPRSKYTPVPVVTPRVTNKGLVCKQVEVIVPRVCASEEVVPAESVCPVGGRAGSGCQEEVPVEKVAVCRSGEGFRMDANGRCFRIKEVPLGYQCPSGTTDAGPKCAEPIEVPAQYSCPAEFQDNGNQGCVRFADLIQPPPQVVTAPVKHNCAAGHHLSHGSAVEHPHVQHHCAEIVHVPRERVCPHNTEPLDEHRCVERAPVVPPPQSVVRLAPAFECPSGGAASGEHCFEHVPLEYICPHGTSPSHDGAHGKCLKSAAPIEVAPRVVKSAPQYICPSGYSNSGGVKCTTVEHAAPLEYCPHGFQESGAGCVRHVPSIVSCPHGYLKTASGCETKKFVPPTVTITKTCTKGQPGCA